MERIVLEVDDNLAKAWRESSPKLKEEYEGKIAELLLELKKKEFFELLDKAGETAARNGMTEDVLNRLLNDE